VKRRSLFVVSLFVLLSVSAYAYWAVHASRAAAPNPDSNGPGPAEVARLLVQANHGSLKAASMLYAHYCLDTDDEKSCDFWLVRMAELGDESARCSLIKQHRDYGMYKLYEANISKLALRGACKP